jgi:hypothetical protein
MIYEKRVSGTDKRQIVKFVRVEKTECLKTIKGGTAVPVPKKGIKQVGVYITFYLFLFIRRYVKISMS